MAAYRRVYGFGHLRADCRGPGSAPEHARFEYGSTLLYITILLQAFSPLKQSFNINLFCLYRGAKLFQILPLTEKRLNIWVTLRPATKSSLPVLGNIWVLIRFYLRNGRTSSGARFNGTIRWATVTITVHGELPCRPSGTLAGTVRAWYLRYRTDQRSWGRR